VRYIITWILLILLLVGCRHDTTKPQQRLVGTWLVDIVTLDGGHFRSVITVAPDGSYSCKFSKATTSGVLTGAIEGRYEINRGTLIDTMTKHSNTNAVLPSVSRAQIIRLDDQELVTQCEGMTNEIVMRKESR